MAAASQGQRGTLFGPITVTRSVPDPNPRPQAFQVSKGAFGAPFMLHVRNGDLNGMNPASVANIALDGNRIVRAPLFTESSGTIDLAVNITQSSVLQVQVLGQPGGTITLWIDGVLPPLPHTIGGTITGLAGTGLVLQDNNGDNLTVAAGATTFTFPTAILSGSTYSVSVLTQPSNPSETCVVSNGSGTIASVNVSDVQITCTPTFSIVIGPTDVNVGDQQQLTATAVYSNGSRSTVIPQSWNSANTQVATVSSTGVVTGVSYGQSVISATFSGVTGNATVNVHGGVLNVTVEGTVTGTVNVTGPGYAASISSSQALQIPPGTFTVVGNPVTTGGSRYFPAVQSQPVSVSDGGSAAVTVDYSTIIPNTTKVLDSIGLSSLIVSSDGSTISISSTSSVAGTLNVGDILAVAPCAAAPSGLLLSIISLTPGSTTVTATVQRAALADAIQQADFHYSQAIGPTSLTPASRALLALPQHRNSEFSISQPRAQTASGACDNSAITVQLPYSIVLVQDPSGSLTLSGEDDLCANLQMDLEIGFFNLDSFDATLATGIHTSITLTDAVSGSFSASQDLTTLTGSTVPVLIGDVPIGLTPSLTPFVGASGSADASVSTGLTTDSTLTLGASYSNGTWSFLDPDTSSSAASNTSATANATIKGLAGVRVGLSIDTELVPTLEADVSLNADGYLQLTAGLNRNPCWSLDAGLEGNVGVAAKFLDKTLANYTTPALTPYSTNVSQATGPCYTVTVTPGNQSIDVGQSVQLAAQETDLLGNIIDASFNWTSSDSTIATVDQNGNVSGAGTGSATITATDPKTTISGTATVIVAGGAPTYFMVGNWAGTVTFVESDGITTTYNVGASLAQTATSFTGTLTGLAEGDVPVTYTVNGQIASGSIGFTIGSTDDTTTEAAIGGISADGLQVSGSGVDGSNGSIIWNGNQTITGTASLEPGSEGNETSGTVTWTGTISISADGQTLTGSGTASTGDTVTWNLTRQ